MANPLAHEIFADRSRDTGIISSPEQRTHVHLFNRKEAVPQLAVRGETDAVAVQAKRLAHACDEADVPFAVTITELCSGGTFILIGNNIEFAKFSPQPLEHLVHSQHLSLVPEALTIERHELDETNLDSSLATKAGHRENVGFSYAFYRHRVQLDRPKA